MDKRLVFFLSILSILILAGTVLVVTVFIKGEGDLNKQLNKKRNTRILSENEIIESEAISKLNGIRKHYVKEGVYTFNYDVNQSFNEIDKFGNEIRNTRYLYTNNYEVSFIGEKIIVLNKRKGIAEEMHLSKSPTISELSEWRVVYDFKISNWSVRNIKSGNILFSLNNLSGETLSVVATRDSPPIFISKFKIFLHDDTYRDQYTDDDPLREAINTGIYYFRIQNLLYYYDDYCLTPEYVKNAKYSIELINSFKNI